MNIDWVCTVREWLCWPDGNDRLQFIGIQYCRGKLYQKVFSLSGGLHVHVPFIPNHMDRPYIKFPGVIPDSDESHILIIKSQSKTKKNNKTKKIQSVLYLNVIYLVSGCRTEPSQTQCPALGVILLQRESCSELLCINTLHRAWLRVDDLINLQAVGLLYQY